MVEVSRETAPSDAALRRALRRARDGVTIDVAEASVLLAARGEALDELLSVANVQ
jgi:FO synthase